jgi:hypothetical protein
MLEIEPGNRMITVMNPQGREQGGQLEAHCRRAGQAVRHIERGTRHALRRHSSATSSRPSTRSSRIAFRRTNLKVLADCYEKDFAGLISEICIDELPSSSLRKRSHLLSTTPRNLTCTKMRHGGCSSIRKSDGPRSDAGRPQLPTQSHTT